MAIQDINVGSIPNDGTGDSIRDAMIKTNDNFAFLDSARQNLTTGNLIATGNITLQASVPSYWSGTYYLNGTQIATVGTTFSGGQVANPTSFQASTPSISNVTGAVTITGGLGVAGATFLTDLNARRIISETSLEGATLSIGGVVSMPAQVTTGNLITNGYNQTSGNVQGANINAGIGSFVSVSGTLLTNAQPFVTSLGTLTALATTGNLTAANIVLTGWGNIIAANAILSGLLSTGNLRVSDNTVVGGNITSGNVNSGIGTFGNLTVRTIPTVNSVTTKGYVTATVVGFAIGLGS